jgi:glucan 1,3-beta-glucosidase
MYQVLLQLPALLCVLVVAASPVASTPVNATDLTKRASRWGFPYGSTKVRGVNLGGWLVLEVSRDEASSQFGRVANLL